MTDGSPALAVTVCCDKHNDWTPFALTKGADGGWHGHLPIPESSSWIHYFYLVDGRRVLDPNVQKAQDPRDAGGKVNLFQSRY